MQGRRYREEQIVRVLGEVEGGRSIAEISRQYGVSEGTSHRWRRRFGGMELSEVKRLRDLAGENARLKRIVADQVLDIAALKELLRGKW